MPLEDIQAQKLADLTAAMEHLDRAEADYEQKKADAKDAKDEFDACKDQVISIAKDLRDIARGTYQPELPFKGPGRETSPAVEINGVPVGSLDDFSRKVEKVVKRVEKEQTRS